MIFGPRLGLPVGLCKTTQDAINRASLFLYSYPHKLDHVLALAKM